MKRRMAASEIRKERRGEKERPAVEWIILIYAIIYLGNISTRVIGVGHILESYDPGQANGRKQVCEE